MKTKEEIETEIRNCEALLNDSGFIDRKEEIKAILHALRWVLK